MQVCYSILLIEIKIVYKLKRDIFNRLCVWYIESVSVFIFGDKDNVMLDFRMGTYALGASSD